MQVVRATNAAHQKIKIWARLGIGGPPACAMVGSQNICGARHIHQRIQETQVGSVPVKRTKRRSTTATTAGKSTWNTSPLSR